MQNYEGKLVQFSTVYRLDSTQTVSGFFKKHTLNSSSEGQCVLTNIVSEACSRQLDTSNGNMEHRRINSS